MTVTSRYPGPWTPIESAPMDGTNVLVTWGTRPRLIIISCFAHDYDDNMNPIGDGYWCHPRGGKFFSPPTHFAFLPKPITALNSTSYVRRVKAGTD